jgi:transposase
MVEGTEGSHHKEGSRKMSKHNTVYAGIDTGKRKLDVALTGHRERLQVDNAANGHKALSEWLRRHRVKRVGIEASGGYEQEIVGELRRQGFVVVVFQPAQVRAYAKFHLRLAKNDKIDAGLIADCTAAIKKIHAAPDPRLAPFAEHLTMIDQVKEDIARFKTRLETCRDQRIRRLWKEEIARLEKLERVELKQLVATIRQHPDLAERLDLIASVDSVGLQTAVAILVRMPEIGQLTREEVAALAGLAPYDDDSGEQTNVRHIQGGRERLRKALYCAVWPGILRGWNEPIRVLYDRLIGKGKLHKVARIACARKLLIYVNTVVARGTPWVETPTSVVPSSCGR